jgi:hypothetical protein
MWQCMAMANHLSVYYCTSGCGKTQENLESGWRLAVRVFGKHFMTSVVHPTPPSARPRRGSDLFFNLGNSPLLFSIYVQRSDKTNSVQYSPMLADVEDFQMHTFFSQFLFYVTFVPRQNCIRLEILSSDNRELL